MITTRSIVTVSKSQVSCPLAEGKAILQLEDGTYYGLDPVGARIWDLIQTPQPVEKVLESLLAEYEVDRGRCEGDLVRLLENLAEHGLIRAREPETV